MIRKFTSCSPLTNEILKQFDFITDSQLQNQLQLAANGYQIQKQLTIQQKQTRLQQLQILIEQNQEKYAKLITTETGKPISQSLAEVKKSASHCKYISENLDKIFRTERVKTEAKKSLIIYQSLGVIYQMVPFNFPYWLIFKGMISSLTAGNSALVRGSDSTPLTSLAVEELFKAAGFDTYEYQNVFSSPQQLELICQNRTVGGIAFTGSTKAGSQIAQIAAKYIKKQTLELGGNDPMVICEDADIDLAVDLAVRSRIANAGQVCISSKRFIINNKIYDTFADKLIKRLQKVKIGDPFLNETELGPIARQDLLLNLESQLQKSVQQGAKIAYGGNRTLLDKYPNGNFFEPTVLENVNTSNIIHKEEFFGPVFPLFKVKNDQEAISLANDSQYGLSATVVSKDLEKAEQLAMNIESGNVFVNEVPKSDSRVPMGGVKESGYGRECGYHGSQEFTNVKTLWIK